VQGRDNANEQFMLDMTQNRTAFNMWSRFADKSEVAAINRALRDLCDVPYILFICIIGPRERVVLATGVPKGCACVHAGSVAGFDHGAAQEVSSDQDEQGD
jgi:hypothetical protein